MNTEEQTDLDIALETLARIAQCEGRGAGRAARHMAKNALVKLLPRSSRKDLAKLVREEESPHAELEGLRREIQQLQKAHDRAFEELRRVLAGEF